MYIDAGRKEVDNLLGKMERKVAKEYKQAAKEVEQKLSNYLSRFDEKDKKKQEQLKDGTITQAEYDRWRTGQIAMGNRWKSLRDNLAQDYTNAQKIAESIVDGYMPEVYALSHNYATYEVEKGANLDTSYTLYDRQTVERLMRDNPQMLPKPGKQMSKDIREGKIKRWNQKQVQSVMTQALLQGESIPKIAKRLANHVAVKDTKSSVRYARTMTTGAENAGRQNGYKRAIDMGVKMKQGWVAALDSRTRDEHRRLDGQQREVGKPFEVDNMKIMYPGDPTAPGKLVWNCRCCLVAVVAGSNQDLTDLSNRNTSKMGGMTYDQWKNAKRKKEKQEKAQQKANQSNTEKTKQSKTFAEKIADIKSRIPYRGQMGKPTEEEFKEAGKVLAEEVKAYRQPLKEKWEEAEKALQNMKDDPELAKLTKQRTELLEKLTTVGSHVDLDTVNSQLRDISKKISDLSSSRIIEYNKLASEATKARIAYEGTREGNAQWLKNKLAEVREMGSEGLDIKGHLDNSKSPKRKVIEEAYDCYPKDWVKKSVSRGKMTVVSKQRGYYSEDMWGAEIAISGSGSVESFETAIHEIGHRMEKATKDILSAEDSFYEGRTEGEKLEWLGMGYRKNEKTRRDKFLDKYMGKDYGGDAYELVSMGFEYAYCDPNRLADDPDMESWIYGLLILGE